jgi:hypothetical protein
MKELIASLAVFRELYDKNKDIYDVLRLFIITFIVDHNIKSFTETSLTQKLNNEYHFKIPEAVIKISLKRLSFLSKKYGEYIVDNSNIPSIDNFSALYNQSNNQYQMVKNKLIHYIQTIHKIDLNNDAIKEIEAEFYDFLIDQNETKKYTKYISLYLISETDLLIINSLKDIREGFILYNGIIYTDNSRLGSWDAKITIYLDTEILFYMAGYDGELYKMFFNDFYNYVKEINSKSSKKLIELKYFPSTKNEIDNFFTKACDIVAGNDILNPEKTAMVTIVQNCKLKSDVIIKKADFFTLLANNGIEFEDEYIDLTKAENYSSNIYDKAILDSLTNSLNYDVFDDIELLNNINIRRNKQEKRIFSKIGCILVTGNKNILSIAHNELIRRDGDVPLATTLSWLTNKFWYKLNKGFGNNITPHNSDIIIKSKIIMSSIIGEKTSSEYDKMISDNKKGNLTKEQAQNQLILLKKMNKKPENIIANDIQEMIEFLDEDSLEKAKNEHEYLSQKYNETEIRNQELKSKIDNDRREIINDKTELLATKEKYKNVLDKRCKSSKYLFCFLKNIFRFLIPFIIFFMISYFVVNTIAKMNDHNIGVISILITLIAPISLMMITIVFNKKIEVLPLINNLYKFLERLSYNFFTVDIDEYNKIESEIVILKELIANISIDDKKE